jgi:hypothetical protein
VAEERKKVWIDPFQTKLSIRICCYLVIFLVVLCNFLFAWKMIVECPIDPWQQFLDMLRDHLPVIVCLVVLVPVIAWDTIRFTHRLVGPLGRWRRTMQSIANGEAVTPLKLREGDYLTDFRDDFNKMLEVLQKQGVPVLKPLDPAKDDDAQKKTA